MKNRPIYALASVDHALHLAQLLQQEGPMRVSEAAERVGVARSTAHRLLSMLVYRDFAEQGLDKRYTAGRVLRVVDRTPDSVAVLRSTALPHLTDLVDRVQETANLMVRVGTHVRFVAAVECRQILRAGDREGTELPAHLTSGGKLMLGALTDDQIVELYSDGSASEKEIGQILRQVRSTRHLGYAINDQLSEKGLSAIGVLLGPTKETPLAAITLAVPTARFARSKIEMWLKALNSTSTLIGRSLLQSQHDD
jgi:IclR family acetate operon transcriptional repressor